MSSGFGEGMGDGRGASSMPVAPELAGSGMRILGPELRGPRQPARRRAAHVQPGARHRRVRHPGYSPGNIAVLSQSGGMGFAVAQWGTAVGLDFSYIITTGNEYDLDCLELAGAAGGHPGDRGRGHAHRGRAATWRSSRPSASASGRRASASSWPSSARRHQGARGAYAHTRHVTGDTAEYRRLFRACGIAEAADAEELIDVVQAIAKSRKLGTRELPPGARIGIATTSGGAGVWLADACAERGLAVPVLSAPVQETMKGHMPPFGSPVNPVDLTAQLTAGGSVAPALAALAGSGEVDAIALVTSLSSAGRLERD